MSNLRYVSQDTVKEPHPISLKVLRLSRPSLVSQCPVSAPTTTALPPPAAIVPASLAYSAPTSNTNTDPFLLSPILNLPPAFGSAYVGEIFSCTLCVNHDAPDQNKAVAGGSTGGKAVRNVYIEAEMKMPSTATPVKLPLTPGTEGTSKPGVDLEAGETLQKVVRFDLKEEGSHVLAVTVNYYEASETSGRTRTFRKLYQFVCKASLIVRTKTGPFSPLQRNDAGLSRRWVLEAQLENCGEDVIQLERVLLDLDPALAYEDCNWEMDRRSSGGGGSSSSIASLQQKHGKETRKPVLHPGEVEQVCFLLEEKDGPGLQEQSNGRLVFGVLGIGWRGEMGNHGFLSTGKLGTRSVQ